MLRRRHDLGFGFWFCRSRCRSTVMFSGTNPAVTFSASRAYAAAVLAADVRLAPATTMVRVVGTVNSHSAYVAFEVLILRASSFRGGRRCRSTCMAVSADPAEADITSGTHSAAVPAVLVGPAPAITVECAFGAAYPDGADVALEVLVVWTSRLWGRCGKVLTLLPSIDLQIFRVRVR